MADKLTQQQVVQLIKSYQKKECLWNRDNKHYRDFAERNKCYDDLCKEFSLPEAEIKKKIVNLRTWFARVLRRVESSVMEQDDTVAVYDPANPIFDSMRFLSNVLRRQTKERRRIIKKEEENVDGLQIEEYIIEEKYSTIPDDYNEYEPIEEESSLSPTRHQHSGEERQSKRIKFECPTPDSFTEDARSQSTEHYSENYNSKERDEIDYFCQSLASQMRKLTTRSMIELQMEIQNAVSQKRLEDWDKTYKH